MAKKPLLVTLADKKYLEYAKQVFAGAYFNAGWKGDYMLLAHNIPEEDLQWFRNKKILIKHCKPLYDKPIAETPPSFISRFYLFTPEFKKWSHVIYVDVDVIIRASLDELLKKEFFGAVINNHCYRGLNFEIISGRGAQKRNISQKKYFSLKSKIQRNFDLKNETFCAGFFVFNSKIINSEYSISTLKSILDDYQEIAANADQFALNILFYKKWQRLPLVYDVYASRGADPWYIPAGRIKGIVLHIQKEKPWDKSSPFYREWKANFKKAHGINLGKVLKVKKWSQQEIENYSQYLERRELLVKIFFGVNWLRSRKTYYSILNFFEKNFPSFFKALKKTKRKIIRFSDRIINPIFF